MTSCGTRKFLPAKVEWEKAALDEPHNLPLGCMGNKVATLNTPAGRLKRRLSLYQSVRGGVRAP
jgi:hypothetical protein